MARFDKIAVLDKIGSTGMVPVLYQKDAEVEKKDRNTNDTNKTCIKNLRYLRHSCSYKKQI